MHSFLSFYESKVPVYRLHAIIQQKQTKIENEVPCSSLHERWNGLLDQTLHLLLPYLGDELDDSAGQGKLFRPELHDCPYH